MESVGNTTQNDPTNIVGMIQFIMSQDAMTREIIETARWILYN
jgi:hypothetical protein